MRMRVCYNPHFEKRAGTECSFAWPSLSAGLPPVELRCMALTERSTIEQLDRALLDALKSKDDNEQAKISNLLGIK